MSHWVKLWTVHVKDATFLRPMPPCEASQPNPSRSRTVEVQFTETGSPYFTTTLEGLNSIGQDTSSPAKWKQNHIFMINTRSTLSHFLSKVFSNHPLLKAMWRIWHKLLTRQLRKIKSASDVISLIKQTCSFAALYHYFSHKENYQPVN